MKKPFFMALTALVLGVLILFVGFEQQGGAPLPRERAVMLVTDDDTGSFFLQLKEGAQAACAEAGALLRTVVLPQGDPCPAVEAELADAVLVFLSGRAGRESAVRCVERHGLPYRVVGGDGPFSVRMDEEGGGALLAGAIPANHTPAVVYASDDADTMRRLKGAQSVLGGLAAIRLDTAGEAPRELFFVRACLALDEKATAFIAQQKKEGRLPASLLVFGCDTGASRIDDLESGTVYAMLMQEPYSLGHQAVRAMMTGRPAPPPRGKVVLRKTMFSSENVRLMFPLIQNE